MKKFILSLSAGLLALSMFAVTPALAQDDLDFDLDSYDYEWDYDTTTELTDEDAALIAGIGLLTFGFFGVFALGLYIYMGLTLMTIGKKLNFESPWMAWVPIANIYMMLKIADLPGWTLILLFIPFINFLFTFFMIYVWMKIAEKRGFESWVGILMIVPVIGIAVPGYIAWAEPKPKATE